MVLETKMITELDRADKREVNIKGKKLNNLNLKNLLLDCFSIREVAQLLITVIDVTYVGFKNNYLVFDVSLLGVEERYRKTVRLKGLEESDINIENLDRELKGSKHILESKEGSFITLNRSYSYLNFLNDLLRTIYEYKTLTIKEFDVEITKAMTVLGNQVVTEKSNGNGLWTFTDLKENPKVVITIENNYKGFISNKVISVYAYGTKTELKVDLSPRDKGKAGIKECQESYKRLPNGVKDINKVLRERFLSNTQ